MQEVLLHQPGTTLSSAFPSAVIYMLDDILLFIWLGPVIIKDTVPTPPLAQNNFSR
jgi:hypothetical protein